MKLFAFKAACRFLATFCACWVASGLKQPDDLWGWSLLIMGCLGASIIALEGYLSESSKILKESD